MFSFRSPPLKAAYFLVIVPVTLFVRLPYWVIISAIPFFRPRRSWTMMRTLCRYGLNALFGMYYDIGLPAREGDPDQDSINPEATGFAWVDSVSSELVIGELAEYARRNQVEPARVYGYWYGARDESGKHGQHAIKGERVLYFLHGGGYVLGSPHHSGFAANIVRGVLEKCPRTIERAFALGYRLSSSFPYPSAGPFPASVIDALSGYRYLVEGLGFYPTNIIVCGDSAGGHLANNLVRYLLNASLPSLSLPGALILLSPAMDWGKTHLGSPESTMETNKSTDFVRPIFLNGYTGTSLRGALEESELDTNSWLSPASLKLPRMDGLFANYPPTFILAGGAEQSVDMMHTFRDRLVHDSGKDKVRYIEYPDAIHDWLNFPWHEPERTQALTELDEWLSGVYGL